jgi:hypothetical protein
VPIVAVDERRAAADCLIELLKIDAGEDGLPPATAQQPGVAGEASGGGGHRLEGLGKG